MEQAAEKFELERDQVARAASFLNRQEEALQLSPAQRLSYRLYTFFVGAFVVCLVGVIVDLAVEFEKKEPSWAFVALSVAFVLCFLFAVLSLVLNIPLIVKIVRSRVLLHRMGLSDYSEILWAERQKTRRWGNLVEKIVLVVGFLCFIISIVGFIVSLLPGRRLAITGLLLGVSFWFLLGIFFMMLVVLHRGKARFDMMASRLKDITRLKQTMAVLGESRSSPGNERISVPPDWIEEFSRIETEEIVRSRTKAISEAVAAPKSSFSILSSAEVLNVKARLNPDDRLKVEDVIDDLTAQPRPGNVEQEVDTGPLRLRVPGTNWEILYVVNDAERQLKLLSLRQAPLAEWN